MHQSEASRQAPERRQFQRVRVDFPARLWLDVGWHQVFCRDLSSGGVGMSVFKSPDVGAKLKVTLQMPGGSEMEVRGTVIHGGGSWSQPFGLKFLGLTREQKASIRRCVQRHLEAERASHPSVR